MNITKSPSLQLLRKLHYQFSGLNDVSISSEGDDWDSVTTVVHRNSGWFSARTSRCSSIMSLTLDWEESKKERELALRNVLKCETLQEPNFKFGLNAFLASDCQEKEARTPERSTEPQSPVSQAGSPLSPSLDYRVSVGALLFAGCRKMEADLKTHPEETVSPTPAAAGSIASPRRMGSYVESSASVGRNSPRSEKSKLESLPSNRAESSGLAGCLSSSSSRAQYSRSPKRAEPKSSVVVRAESPQHVRSKPSESETSDDVSSSAASAATDITTSACEGEETQKPNAREPKDAKRIFVSNLSDNMTKHVLWKFFGKYAKVSDVYLVKDLKTRRSRRRAFVQFATVSDAKQVLSMDESELYLNGRRLFIDAARPKQPKYQTTASGNVNDQKPPRPPMPPSLSVSPVSVLEIVTINSMPCEIMQKIFGFLTIKERIQAEGVCKYWRFIGIEAQWNVKHLSFANQFPIYHHPLSDEVFKCILKRCNRRLSSLEMINCGHHLSYRFAESLAKSCSNLEIVNLVKIPVTNTGLKLISTANTKIRKATMHKCSFGEKGLWWFVKNCVDLECLDVSGNDRIKGLCFHIINPRIKILNLGGCVKLMPKAIFELRRCTGIQEMILSGCVELDTAALQFILNHCSHSLENLHLDSEFPKIDFHGLSCNPLNSVQELSFADNSSIDDPMLEKVCLIFPNVRKLNISGTYVTDSGLQYILECRYLRELDISYLTEITDTGIEMLAMAGQLHSLTIRNSEILTNTAFTDLVAHCKELTYLDISNCLLVSDEVIDEWATIIDLQDRKAELEVFAGGSNITKFVQTPALKVNIANLCPFQRRNVDDSLDFIYTGEDDDDDFDLDFDDANSENAYDEFDERLAVYEMRS